MRVRGKACECVCMRERKRREGERASEREYDTERELMKEKKHWKSETEQTEGGKERKRL